MLDEATLEMDSMADGVQRYSQSWFRLDQLYRKFTYHVRCDGRSTTLLSSLIEQIENLYSNNYLLKLKDRWQVQVDSTNKWNASPVLLQKNFFESRVQRYLKKDKKVYVINNRHFKLFTFSRLFGKYEIKQDAISFAPPVFFYLSSSFDDIISEFANTAFKRDKFLMLGKNKLFCTSIEVFKSYNFYDKGYKIKMLSPVTVYSTVNINGKKKTLYYNPQDEEFERIIKGNLLKKHEAISQTKY